ncbi:50S ribosomal protein L23 [bacterium]|nr:50S ribosomal protein L23 [bacterium]
MDYYALIRYPVLSEKGTYLKEKDNKIILKVDIKANKNQIKKAVEKTLNVKVVTVRTIRMKGKIKRMGRFQGKRADWKKAIVTLAPGEKVSFFEGL